MASIHRRPNSPFYHAAWRTKTGRLILRSTKQTDRSKALEIALSFERAERMAGQDMLTEVQCRKVLGDILGRCGTGETLRLNSIAGYFETWLKNKRVGEGSAKLYRIAVSSLLASLGERAKRPLETLSVDDIESWVTGLADQNAPATVWLYGGIIRGALTKARKTGLVLSNVAEAVELPGRKGITRGTFTGTEVRILIDAAEGEWKTLVLVAYYTGARLSDCAVMRWADIDLANGVWTHKQGKTGQIVSVPLHPGLRAGLEQIATGDKAQEFVMPGLAEEATGGRHGLSDTSKNLVLKAGLDLQTVQGAGGRQQNKRTFHALRHSFTSALANAGVMPELRMKLTGHTNADVHRGYTHHEIETLRQAVEKVPNI
jgi:integrase